MGISDKIEAFIMELMKGDADYAEFGRNELADVFGCVPSQINYVISTRFSPQRGYSVESRRGGGGYIKIRRIDIGDSHGIIANIGEACDVGTARSIVGYLHENGKLDTVAAKILLAAVSDRSLKLQNPVRDRIRAEILKNAIAEI